MRSRVIAVGLALIAVSCSGGRGISPGIQSVDAANVAPWTTTTTSGSEPDPTVSLLAADPVAVPSTTTVPAPGSPPAAITPSTTTPLADAQPAHEAPASVAGLRAPLPGTVALTFDDGPFIGWTETILRVLDEYEITATFFVSTYLLPRNNDLVQRMIREGHSVQSLGNQHQRLTDLTEAEIRSELATSIDRLVDAGAPRPTCFRPPYGATNETVNRIASDLGLEVVMWSVDSFDYVYQEPNAVIESVLTDIGLGDILLMHDQWASIHETTLPVIIETLADRGVGFSSLCEAAPRS